MGCTPAQLALAWVVAQPFEIIPIPATRRREHIVENVKALELRLTARDLEVISTALAQHLVHGARHPDDHMKTIDR
jgi:aryl-alcohol dehydrogenase-like predicted oxidoreductase